MGLRYTILAATISLFSSVSLATVLPSAASLNLCADSLLLELADPTQIVSVSWLARDKTLSNYATLAENYPTNHGRVEELIAHSPDFVFTGSNTSTIDNILLTRLGFEVIRILPDRGLDDYKINLRRVGDLLNRTAQAEKLIDALHKKIGQDLNNQAPAPHRVQETTAIIFQANGYSPGKNSLPGNLLELSGYMSVETQHGEEGKFLTLEELISLQPNVVILASLNIRNPSLADLYLTHPALISMQSRQTRNWHPKVISIQERHLNCGSQFIAESIATMRHARTTASQ